MLILLLLILIILLDDDDDDNNNKNTSIEVKHRIPGLHNARRRYVNTEAPFLPTQQPSVMPNVKHLDDLLFCNHGADMGNMILQMYLDANDARIFRCGRAMPQLHSPDCCTFQGCLINFQSEMLSTVKSKSKLFKSLPRHAVSEISAWRSSH
jgi:hypothetical protein